MSKPSKQTQEALFSLQVDAFIQGVADTLPDPAEYGVEDKDGLVTDLVRSLKWAQELKAS